MRPHRRTARTLRNRVQTDDSPNLGFAVKWAELEQIELSGSGREPRGMVVVSSDVPRLAFPLADPEDIDEIAEQVAEGVSGAVPIKPVPSAGEVRQPLHDIRSQIEAAKAAHLENAGCAPIRG